MKPVNPHASCRSMAARNAVKENVAVAAEKTNKTDKLLSPDMLFK